LLGDRGSGYEIGLRALKAALHQYDCDGRWPELGQAVLRELQLVEPVDLISWVQSAEKREVAALAVLVFRAWERGDTLAGRLVSEAARSLARDAASCAARLTRRGEAIRFVLAGSVFLKQASFCALFTRVLRRLWPKAEIEPLPAEGAWGAARLARRLYGQDRVRTGTAGNLHPPLHADDGPLPRRRQVEMLGSIPDSTSLSPTEERNPRSLDLDRLPLREAVALMLSEEQSVPAALLRESAKIERCIRWIVRAFRAGGRLFYVGAGTSGRVGVLDASECPPTFRTPPEQVQGILAGGQRALWQSLEGAEDDMEGGARAIECRDVTAKDVVIGIAASGRTPFVWGALHEAKRRRARTVLVCFNPRLRFRRCERPGLVMAPEVGPEVLTGSTRLKAGTATKLLLNLFTTLSMVQSGKVISNLMVDVNPSNRKLRERAVRIVRELAGVAPAEAAKALEGAGWVVKDALRSLRPGRASRRRN
jgi:N-acetylmuramic acid 6-phosphate etherase